MYVPGPFQELDLDRLEALIRANSFGVLVSVHDGRPIASHVPFLFERGGGSNGTLIGHLARANPQWHSLADGQTVLAIFQGPHAYISPSWYESPGVPTWNYAVVHLYGKARLVEEEGLVWGIVERLTRLHEAGTADPWSPALSPDVRTRLLGGIVGFEIAVAEVQGKFKLNQNRSAEDQRRVAERLTQTGSDSALALARLMASNLPTTP
jgi:transcriptional regulator